MLRLLIAAVLGSIAGIARAHFPWLGPWTILPLGVVGLGLGYGATNRKAALTGAVFGFAFSLTFLVAGYTGSGSVVGHLPLFTIMSALGGLCASLLAVTGAALARRDTRATSDAA